MRKDTYKRSDLNVSAFILIPETAVRKTDSNSALFLVEEDHGRSFRQKIVI